MLCCEYSRHKEVDTFRKMSRILHPLTKSHRVNKSDSMVFTVDRFTNYAIPLLRRSNHHLQYRENNSSPDICRAPTESHTNPSSAESKCKLEKLTLLVAIKWTLRDFENNNRPQDQLLLQCINVPIHFRRIASSFKFKFLTINWKPIKQWLPSSAAIEHRFGKRKRFEQTEIAEKRWVNNVFDWKTGMCLKQHSGSRIRVLRSQ